MKIKELKEFLKQLPDSMDEATIYSVMNSGCCGDTEELEDIDLDFYPPDEKPEDHPNKFHGMLRIGYSSLPGYKSCRQVAGTKAADKEYWEKVNAHNKGENNG